MIERVHEHIITELQQNSRADTVFIVTAVLLNLVILAVNSAIGAAKQTTTTTTLMFTFVALSVVVNVVVEIGLLKGKQSRIKLISGLLKMYKDQGVEGYYDPSLLTNYEVRYNLFILAVLFMGLVSIIVPFIIRG